MSDSKKIERPTIQDWYPPKHINETLTILVVNFKIL